MKVLFLAPSICTPFSEGRKRFVLDLLRTLEPQHQVFLSTTLNPTSETVIPPQLGAFNYATRRVSHLANPLWRLSEHIRAFKPDAVCVFPFGTFSGARGIASKLFMYLADRICRFRRTPCLTIMYSIDEYSSAKELSRWVTNLAISQRSDWAGPVINVGLRFSHWKESVNCTGEQNQSKTLLFIAGMHEPRIDRVDHILRVRGLGALLRAGKRLSVSGFRLIVAAPLLDDKVCAEYLRTHSDNSWSKGCLELRGFVEVPDIFKEADMFVFPYAQSISQFIPTSVLEAMASMTPVLVSDQKFLASLSSHERYTLVFKTDDDVDLARKIESAFADRRQLNNLTVRASRYVQDNWSIDVSCQQLLDLVEQHANSL